MGKKIVTAKTSLKLMNQLEFSDAVFSIMIH